MAAAVPVEQAGEDGPGVEPLQAAPVDRTIADISAAERQSPMTA